MGQIVRRRKKGRPSKADLARRNGDSPAEERDVRRSLRRRNVKYTIDYDDYLDSDSDDDEEDEEIMIQKKLKLMAKLHPDPPPPPARVSHAPESSSESEDDRRKPPPPLLKKRPISKEEDEDYEENDGGDDDDDVEERGRKAAHSMQLSSPPGTPSDHHQSVTPLPDKKTLELILDKLQKKDIYGVYAEPVDPEELPDYHDVIDHPMDFATVRKQLANGAYSTLEQFESDVFLICSNAMQYNSPETIYHKQASSIQELGRRKFERLRIDFERSEKEVISVQKPKPSSLLKKQIKKPLPRTLLEPIGSDFSSGATLATVAEVLNSSIPTQGTGYEKPSNVDGHVEGNSSLNEAHLEKAEEMLSGKSLSSKVGKKPSVLDDNRRATYNISSEPGIMSESIFTTFEGETKQFVAVGLHAEYSYARSLARFSGSLGPVAWKVASKRIEQALPDGCKYGRGWVEEYEPLPTPVLMVDKGIPSQSALAPKFFLHNEPRKDIRTLRTSIPAKEHSVTKPVIEERQQCVSVPTSAGKPSFLVSSRGHYSEDKPPVGSSVGEKGGNAVNAIFNQKNPLSRFIESGKQAPQKVELNSVPTVNQNNANLVPEKQLPRNAEPAASRSRGTASRNINLPQPVPSKMPDSNGVVTSWLPNGKGVSASMENRMIGSSDRAPSRMERTEAYFPHAQEQGLSDPVQLMKKLAEKTQKQQKSLTESSTDTKHVVTSVPSTRRDDPSNAAAAAARAWMSIGGGAFNQPRENPNVPKSQIYADSLYNPSREFRPQISRVRGEAPNSGAMQFQSENSFSFPTFLPRPVHMVNEPQFQNRPIFFPQLAAADLSRFQVPPPWRGHSPCAQPRQKQECLPPDLNIGFQSPGSPVKQSSGVLDSQQPDLALQL
ncbi:uncharacterized protein LOC126785874 [Argentina anserina]|uniref:uncharacterized protein LOC126785874 n=1 Tax=Argentina anserina TaxID=57926 RepID=UPI0021764543|nr:uncharacterized protein LOC126785874 [Potentilla anserina]